MLRALFEGVAFEHRRHIDVAGAPPVIRFDSAVLSGGGARSPIWPQMFADILGMPDRRSPPAAKPVRSAPPLAPGYGAGLFADLARPAYAR